jgi:hypothetical protein
LGGAVTRVLVSRLQLPKNPNYLSARPRIHAQHVDELGEIVGSRRATSQELLGYRVAVGLIADQEASELVAGLRWQLAEG